MFFFWLSLAKLDSYYLNLRAAKRWMEKHDNPGYLVLLDSYYAGCMRT